jgi:hypothetical protein
VACRALIELDARLGYGKKPSLAGILGEPPKKRRHQFSALAARQTDYCGRSIAQDQPDLIPSSPDTAKLY